MSPSFFTCNSFKFQPITKQVADFVEGLDDSDWEKLTACAERLTSAYLTGRGFCGRSERIRGASVAGLFELKITAPGTRGPQLRLLCVREGSRILCARGVVKRQAHIPRGEIDLAEQAILAFRDETDEARR